MLPQPVVLVLDKEVLESVLMILRTELDDAELSVPVLLGDAGIVLVSWVNILPKARKQPSPGPGLMYDSFTHTVKYD